jgi:hypothetical protein
MVNIWSMTIKYVSHLIYTVYKHTMHTLRVTRLIQMYTSHFVHLFFFFNFKHYTEFGVVVYVQGFIKFKMSMFYICLHCCCPAFCCICMVLFMKSLRTPTGQPEVPLLCHSSTIVLSVGIVFQCLIPYCCMYAV